MTAEIINHRNFWKDIGLYAIFWLIPNVFGGLQVSLFHNENPDINTLATSPKYSESTKK